MSESIIPALRCTELHFRYQPQSGPVQAVNGISLALEPGVVAGLSGPSGSGKTSFLRLAAGLAVPDSGSIEVAGRTMDPEDPDLRAEIRRELLGIVEQQANLLPLFSVAENLELPLQLAGWIPADRYARVQELLELLGLGYLQSRLARELSGGEQQRIAVCQALAPRPAVVLADEPTASLDSVAGGMVMDLLSETARAQGAAVLVATHDPEALERCDVVYQIRDGHLQ